MTEQKAGPLAVEAEPDGGEKAMPLRDRLKALWETQPLPPATGNLADKAFYDELSGEVVKVARRAGIFH